MGVSIPLTWAKPLEGEDTTPELSTWDRLGMWWILAVVLVIIAYAVPLMDIFRMTRFGSPGFKPY